MNNKLKIHSSKSLCRLATHLRSDLKNQDFVLIYAYNGTGKTRLSMEFKDIGKKKSSSSDGDTLYFNAYTEDLFHWDNDLRNDAERALEITDSKFFSGFEGKALESRIQSYLERYTMIRFKMGYPEKSDYPNKSNYPNKIIFSKEVRNPRFRPDSQEPETIIEDNVKVSRGEEKIFIWCIYLAICEMVLDGEDDYKWVKFFYIDDPISSLDDNNAIAVATDLAKLLRRDTARVKAVVSSHHSLFYNVMCNELKKQSHKKYFMYFDKYQSKYELRATTDTPFFQHVAMLSELQKAVESGQLYTHHFNMLRNILEKTATFFGFSDFSACIHGIDDEVLYARALNLLSHGKYSIYEPREMGEDTKDLFRRILKAFMEHYRFELPELSTQIIPQQNTP